MDEVIGFMLLRFAMIAGVILLLLLLLGVVVIVLKKTGRFDRAKQIAEPVVRKKVNDYLKDR